MWQVLADIALRCYKEIREEIKRTAVILRDDPKFLDKMIKPTVDQATLIHFIADEMLDEGNTAIIMGGGNRVELTEQIAMIRQWVDAIAYTQRWG